MDETFEIGDRVVLNSGGPIMRVVAFRDDGRAIAEWVAEDGRRCEASFDTRCIYGVPDHKG